MMFLVILLSPWYSNDLATCFKRRCRRVRVLLASCWFVGAFGLKTSNFYQKPTRNFLLLSFRNLDQRQLRVMQRVESKEDNKARPMMSFKLAAVCLLALVQLLTACLLEEERKRSSFQRICSSESIWSFESIRDSKRSREWDGRGLNFSQAQAGDEDHKFQQPHQSQHQQQQQHHHHHHHHHHRNQRNQKRFLFLGYKLLIISH